ncbi:hypothetical protein D3C87_1379930 [compost metagenome]
MQYREMQARVALEPGWEHAHDTVTAQVTTLLSQTQETLFAVNWLQVVLQHAVADSQHPFAEAFEAFLNCVADRLEWIAKNFAGERSDDQGHQLHDVLAALSCCQAHASRLDRRSSVHGSDAWPAHDACKR